MPGRPFADHRRVVEGIIYRFRCGLAWRDVPVEFGPWQTLWKRHRRYSGDGTWDHILAALLADADSAGLVGWVVSVDSSIIRAHQHAATLSRDTGGRIELQESAHRAARSRRGSFPRRPDHEDPPAR
ncbi:transposase [Pseudonocardia alni]|uniref:transposase n=1 Tax=Pseudonocardia TaxID=1847 RepID=UPI0009FA1FA0|nr:transposase [Pseudonocardia sp. SID8383]